MICKECEEKCESFDVEMKVCSDCRELELDKMRPMLTKELLGFSIEKKQQFIRSLLMDHKKIKRTIRKMSPDKKEDILVDYIKNEKKKRDTKA